jgi:ABC-type glycerol-3-phosphate transport system substrate-binding protein
MEMRKIALVLGFALLLFAACGSAPSSKTSDLTGVTSYYVRADGNDKNTGTSEDSPFKTLTKALEAAEKTSVKKITVIGTLVDHA